MAIRFNGKKIASMSFGGKKVKEVWMNGSKVWPESGYWTVITNNYPPQYSYWFSRGNYDHNGIMMYGGGQVSTSSTINGNYGRVVFTPDLVYSYLTGSNQYFNFTDMTAVSTSETVDYIFGGIDSAQNTTGVIVSMSDQTVITYRTGSSYQGGWKQGFYWPPKLEMMGGYNQGYSVLHQDYNINTGTLTWKSECPVPITGHRVVQKGTSYACYVIGGKTISGMTLNYVFYFNSSTETWTQLGGMPYYASFGSAVIDHKKEFIYYVGGEDGTGSLSKFYRYWVNYDEWEELVDLPVLRSKMGIYIDPNDQYIWVTAGRTADGTTNSYIYRYTI